MLARTVAIVLAALLLAGCADPADPAGDAGVDAGGDAARPATATATDPPTGDDADALAGDPARWYAFAFDREVEAKSGGQGRIKSYSYTTTNEEHGEALTVDVDVTLEGVAMEPIRTQKMDLESGTFEPIVVSNDLMVAKLRHVLTVVKDDSGERAEGETATVDVYIPTDALPESSTFVWYFTKMSWVGEDGNGTWEYYLTPEMQAQQEDGAFFLPFEGEGSGTSWWGFELMTGTYGLSYFTPFVTGAQAFEEGSHSYGGYSQSVQRETFRIGAYSFDGWTVELSGNGATDWMMKASPDLPLPVAYRFGSDTSGSSIMSYELTDLELG